MNMNQWKQFRSSTNRLTAWDYRLPGYYFITICTQNKQQFFGNIYGEMFYKTKLGEYAESCWKSISEHFPFIFLDEFTVMPNHVHGILIIQDKYVQNVETQYVASLQNKQLNKFGPQSANIASVIRGFKSGVTTFARKNSITFDWQPGYYDHIIRSEQSLMKIREYIRNNILKWDLEKNSIESLPMDLLT